MQVQDVVSRDPVCCDRESHLADVARLMETHQVRRLSVVDERVSEPRVES